MRQLSLATVIFGLLLAGPAAAQPLGALPSLAGLIAQHHRTMSLYDCARIATHIHGLAADRWAQRHGHAGLTAMDLLAEVPAALQEFPQP